MKSGILQDARFNADLRTNSLIISAPAKTMELVLALVRDLDVPPTARSEINIYNFQKADAATIGAMLQQLFVGSGSGVTQQALPGIGGAAQGVGISRPLQLTVGGQTPQGALLIDLRITVDQRTNSLIVAGSRNDLDVIEAIVSRLEDSPVKQRQSKVYRLKNAIAADVAAALSDFINQSLTAQSQTGLLTPFQQNIKQIILVPEPISNTLLVSATEQYFDQLADLIQQLDALPPQVMIQALIAQVTMNDLDEFGVELGIQSPILFQRSILPGGATNNNAAIPGFNFNSTADLGQSTLTDPRIIGVQGINNLGVGRASPTAAIGGFIFSAASDSVNILVRALRLQGRLDILSRPQVMTSDNQGARVLVGQEFPYITGSTTTVTTGFPTVSNQIAYKDVGVQLQVSPKINPDGSVIMRVFPSVSKVSATQIAISTDTFAAAFDTQLVETTVIAQDGETVVIGGLINRDNEKQEAKIPWLGDLPGVGSLFRYRTQKKNKTELLIILTPHIVRNRADAERIFAEESHRMDWVLGNITKMHGVHGMEPAMPNYQIPPRTPPLIPGSPYAPFINPPLLPGGPGMVPSPIGPEQLPLPQPVPTPGDSSQKLPVGPTNMPGTNSQVNKGSAVPVSQPNLQPIGKTYGPIIQPQAMNPSQGRIQPVQNVVQQGQPASTFATSNTTPRSIVPVTQAPTAAQGSAPAPVQGNSNSSTQGRESQGWRLFPRLR
ncbi:MAG: secretin N-terminal domain-containing protein [Bdellovibrionales bacterium]